MEMRGSANDFFFKKLASSGRFEVPLLTFNGHIHICRAMNGKAPKQCLLVVGDGFSRSLLRHMGIDNLITTSPLLPAPPHVQYVPYGDQDPYKPQAIWSQELFPDLWREWGNFLRQSNSVGNADLAFRRFCNAKAQEEKSRIYIDTDNDRDGSFNICTSSPGYQLRAYLFEIFRSYDHLFRSSVTYEVIETWPWFRVIHDLVRNFKLHVISFNYDCNVEGAIECAGGKVGLPPVRWYAPSGDLGQLGVHVIKPHGSITYQSACQFRIGPKKWRQRLKITHSISSPYVIPQYPPQSFPVIPDLVPPGFDGTLTHYPDDTLREYTNSVIRSADVIVWCGLSAKYPDTREIEDYLSNVRRDSLVIHVGLLHDQEDTSGQLLRRWSTNYRFCDGGGDAQVPFVVPWALQFVK